MPSETKELMRGFRKLEAKKFRHLRHVDQEETDDVYAAAAVNRERPKNTGRYVVHGRWAGRRNLNEPLFIFLIEYFLYRI